MCGAGGDGPQAAGSLNPGCAPPAQVERPGVLQEVVGHKRLQDNVQTILQRIERELDHVDSRIGNSMHVLDLDNDGLVRAAGSSSQGIRACTCWNDGQSARSNLPVGTTAAGTSSCVQRPKTTCLAAPHLWQAPVGVLQRRVFRPLIPVNQLPSLKISRLMANPRLNRWCLCSCGRP